MKDAGKDGVQWKDRRTGRITIIKKERSLRQRITEALKREKPIKATLVFSTGLASNASNFNFKSPSFVISLPRASIILSTTPKSTKNAKRGAGRPPGTTTRPPEFQGDLLYLITWQREKALARQKSTTARQGQPCASPPAHDLFDPAIWKLEPPASCRSRLDAKRFCASAE